MNAPIGELLEFAIDAASIGGKETLRWFRQSPRVEDKAEGTAFDPVTAADRACERFIRERIQRVYPSHALVGEEFGELGSSDYTWIVDPIDGTRAFISGFLHWGVLLGLLYNGAPRLGVLVQPFTREVFFGTGDSAYYRYGKRTIAMRTRSTASLGDATLATTDPHLFESSEDASMLARIESKVRLVRYGSDCYQYAMLALGQLDVVVENQLKPWDILPLIPILLGAGVVVTDWQGGDDWASGNVIASATQALHDDVMAQITPLVN